jgi:GT2 family glycosyltransferase
MRKFAERDSRIKLIRNKKNLGFAAGNNVGISCAKGDYIVFLNNDTEVDPSWLKELIRIANTDETVGALQSKILLLKDRTTLDACGSYLTPYGFLYHQGILEKDIGQYDQESEIFAAKGAAMLVRRSLLNEIGLFDPEYFCYYEELDLCWRIWLRGYKIIFIPKSIVYHALGGTTRRINSDLMFFYHGHKNYINTLIKNLSFSYLIRFIVPYLLLFFCFALYSTLKGSKLAIFWTTKAWIWVLRNIRTTYRKRIFVQAFIRKLPDKILIKQIMKKIPFLTYFRSLIGSQNAKEVGVISRNFR